MIAEISFDLKFLNGAGLGGLAFPNRNRSQSGAVEVVQHRQLNKRAMKTKINEQKKRTNVSDACLIAFAGFGYCDKLELSLLNVEDVINENGSIKKNVIIPTRISGKSHNRYFNVGKSGILFDLIKLVVEWRIANNYDLLNKTKLFAGLQPQSKFFKKPDGSDFKFKVCESGKVTPYTLTNYCNRVNDGEGINITQLNGSFIVNFWNDCKKYDIAEEDIIKALGNQTGLTNRTLRTKIVFGDDDVKQVSQKMYSRVRL